MKSTSLEFHLNLSGTNELGIHKDARVIEYLDGKQELVCPRRSMLWLLMTCRCKGPGGRLNKKDGPTRYGDSHVKDKTS